MFDRILLRMRELVRRSRYVATAHAAEEMEADGLTIFDVEHSILTGEIVERQRDPETGAVKYVIEGYTLTEKTMYTVVRIAPTGTLVFITVYVA